MTAIDYPAMLRALADHIEKHDLPEPLTIKRSEGRLALHVYDVTGTRAWIGTLTDTSTLACAFGDTAQVHVDGLAGNLALQVTVCLAEHETAARDAMLAALPDPDSDDWQPVELPDFLGGAR
jgi:hypothetical protein